MRDRAVELPEAVIIIFREAVVKLYAASAHVVIATPLTKLTEGVHARRTQWKWRRVTLHLFLTSQVGCSYSERRS